MSITWQSTTAERAADTCAQAAYEAQAADDRQMDGWIAGERAAKVRAAVAHCGRCHTCGGGLVTCLDGEEWCAACRRYPRYRSHGWSLAVADGGSDVCPAVAGLDAALADVDREIRAVVSGLDDARGRLAELGSEGAEEDAVLGRRAEILDRWHSGRQAVAA